jgi:chromosome segregation ATPase
MLLERVHHYIEKNIDTINFEIIMHSGFLKSNQTIKNGNDTIIKEYNLLIGRILVERLCELSGIDLNRPVGTERQSFVIQIERLNSRIQVLESSIKFADDSLKTKTEQVEELERQLEVLRNDRLEILNDLSYYKQLDREPQKRGFFSRK